MRTLFYLIFIALAVVAIATGGIWLALPLCIVAAQRPGGRFRMVRRRTNPAPYRETPP
jgi:hypothetical protein